MPGAASQVPSPMSGILAPERSMSSLTSGVIGAALAIKSGVCVLTNATAATARRNTRRDRCSRRIPVHYRDVPSVRRELLGVINTVRKRHTPTNPTP